MESLIFHEATSAANSTSNLADLQQEVPSSTTTMVISSPQSTLDDTSGQSTQETPQLQNEILTTNAIQRIAHSPPVDIQFENISYTANMGFRKGKKEILHKINGRFPPGQLVAIMGPSGAGKSTLLDVLSGYRIRGTEGTVLTNGLVRDLKLFRKLSCYITQDDRLQGLLTTAENMSVAADLKLPSHVPSSDKDEIINDILALLGLSAVRNTKSAELSGGQKKRLSIALELINNPMVMFLDEPTTGLDSSSCTQCIRLLKTLTRQGRTIVCTIHQPSATLYQMFDQVYVLSEGKCLYQGATEKLIPFLSEVDSPCPRYHNPADFVIELACGEHGFDRIERMIKTSENGSSLRYFVAKVANSSTTTTAQKYSLPEKVYTSTTTKACTLDVNEDQLLATSSWNQLSVLLRRSYIKCKRDRTLTYMRILVNILVAVMLGSVYWQSGSNGTKVIDNYNLLFSILIHHMMSTMMLTILTFPSEMSIVIKEHFNRWYSLKMYYASVSLIDTPISVICSVIFSVIIYYMSGQPADVHRVVMFTIITILVVFTAQSFGLMIGAVMNVVNGTFIGPTLSVPMMMFAGFGVTIRDLPWYFYWGSYVSYLRYGLEGYVGAIYGMDRPIISCPEDAYCHYKYPKKFLEDVAMRGDRWLIDVIALTLTVCLLRVAAYYFLKYKLKSLR